MWNKIHADTCIYMQIHRCMYHIYLVHMRYGLRYILCTCRAYASCMSLTYILIHQSICVLYVLQIYTHMHWQDHWWREARVNESKQVLCRPCKFKNRLGTMLSCDISSYFHDPIPSSGQRVEATSLKVRPGEARRSKSKQKTWSNEN